MELWQYFVASVKDMPFLMQSVQVKNAVMPATASASFALHALLNRTPTSNTVSAALSAVGSLTCVSCL